ncbi:Tat_binding protein 1(TBP-1)-interacting protein [Hexamita inflata]|uniref:Tat binding protein 1(TBP-1)-interacting protein n=1 Tax=Hexamita inflata TaxID=28002 RepID=A0AA86TIK3_9EUKA|nr:Tat binding protein 1(TBP-1)-interacting protein [Hexamita inflata]
MSCQQEIQQMMQQTNRPQNVQSVINNTGSKYGKTAVEKALNALVDSGKLTFTEVGKMGKLYIWNQSLLKVISNEEQAEITKNIIKLKEQNQTLRSSVATLKEVENQYNSIPTDEQLQKSITSLTKQIESVQQDLKQYENKPQISEKEINEVKTKLKKFFQVWNNRSQTVKEFVSNIAEGMEKKDAEVRDMVGVDAGLPRFEIMKFNQLVK